MSTIVIPDLHEPRIQPRIWTRNRESVRTSVEDVMRRRANQIMAYRGREQFCGVGRVPAIFSGGLGQRTRWRYLSHTAPHTTLLRVRMRIARRLDQAGAPGTTTPSCRFTLSTPAGATIGSFEAFYGATTTGTPTDTPDTWGVFEGEIAVSPDIDVQGVFSDHDDARLLGAVVWEESPPHDTLNGYQPPAPAQGAEILDADRERLVTFANAQWRRNGSQCFNWCKDNGTALTRTLATDSNILDGLGAVSAASDGWTLDMTGKDLFQQATGVPCTFAAFGSATANGAANVRIKNAAGTTIASVALTTTLGWQTTTVILPATSAKYDVTLASNGTATASLFAVSCFEFMA